MTRLALIVLQSQASSLCDGLTVDQQVELLNSMRGIEAAAWVFALAVFGLLVFVLVRLALQTRRIESAARGVVAAYDGFAEQERLREAYEQSQLARLADVPRPSQDASPTQTMKER